MRSGFGGRGGRGGASGGRGKLEISVIGPEVVKGKIDKSEIRGPDKQIFYTSGISRLYLPELQTHLRCPHCGELVTIRIAKK
jgi:hypothetical protein